MTSCCPPPPMPWNGATGAIARCKRVSTGCGRKSRSVRALHWICGVKRKPKAVNKPWHHCIVHGLDKPGVFTTVSDFIKYFIFPGSCLPSVSAIADCVARVTDLRIMHLDDIGPHYATTLRHWRERFMAQKARLERLGYSASFQRMWEFYLCYCEAGFRERHISDVQF